MSKWLERSSLAQLTKVRFLEYLREPEAIFWSFIFPVLLAAGLGIAFRNQPAQVVRIGSTDARLAAALRTEKGLQVVEMDRAGRVDGAYTILALVCVETWCRLFVDTPAAYPAEVA